MSYTINLPPSRIVAVINDSLVPGVQFQQSTKSGKVWTLVWNPENDRLFKWDCPSQTWIRIKSDVISVAKKTSLSKV
jgi:hypothetical protein